MPALELEELLCMPRWALQRSAWRHLTTGDALFRALHGAVQKHTQGTWLQWLNGWEEYVQQLDQLQIRRWNIARSLVWCAEQAIAQPDLYRSEIDRVCLALGQPPGFVQDEAWAWVCIRTFLDAPSRRVEVYVASWDEPDKDRPGDIITLVLEALEGGAGQIALHPQDAFAIYPDDLNTTTMVSGFIELP